MTLQEPWYDCVKQILEILRGEDFGDVNVEIVDPAAGTQPWTTPVSKTDKIFNDGQTVLDMLLYLTRVVRRWSSLRDARHCQRDRWFAW